VLYDNRKIGFIQGSWRSIKDLKEMEVFLTSKDNCGDCLSINQGSRGTKRRHSKEDLLGKKIKGLHASLRIKDLRII